MEPIPKDSKFWSSHLWWCHPTHIGKIPMSQKDFDWRNAGALERRVKADWESVKKRTSWLRKKIHRSTGYKIGLLNLLICKITVIYSRIITTRISLNLLFHHIAQGAKVQVLVWCYGRHV